MDTTTHHRQSIRKPGFDYSLPGWYFLTLCTAQHRCVLGHIENAMISRTYLGELCEKEWLRLPDRFSHIRLDEFVIMPNHLHGIIQILDDIHKTDQTQSFGYVVRGSTSAIVRSFKISVTRKFKNQTDSIPTKIWQRGYWDRILRSEDELIARRQYILNNPYRWDKDQYFQI